MERERARLLRLKPTENGFLTDQQLTNVSTCIRSRFGNKASDVTADEVKTTTINKVVVAFLARTKKRASFRRCALFARYIK